MLELSVAQSLPGEIHTAFIHISPYCGSSIVKSKAIIIPGILVKAYLKGQDTAGKFINYYQYQEYHPKSISECRALGDDNISVMTLMPSKEYLKCPQGL